MSGLLKDDKLDKAVTKGKEKLAEKREKEKAQEDKTIETVKVDRNKL